MYKEVVKIDSNSILDKKKFLAMYPTVITVENYNKLDDSGIIKKGLRINTGEILVAHLHREEFTKEDQLIAAFNKKYLKSCL